MLTTTCNNVIMVKLNFYYLRGGYHPDYVYRRDGVMPYVNKKKETGKKSA